MFSNYAPQLRHDFTLWRTRFVGIFGGLKMLAVAKLKSKLWIIHRA